VRFHPPGVRVAGLLAAMVGLAICSGCGKESRPDRGRYLPSAEVARRAVEEALGEWKKSWRIERTTSALRPVMFVEQQQPPGQKLLGFDILGETPGYETEGYRRFLVRLSLAEPEDTVVAAYYVFGQGPVWVYRAEDFDMIMHMDKSMMPPPPTIAPADRARPSAPAPAP